MEKYVDATLNLDTGFGSDYIPLELTPDSQPCLYQLYTPEQLQYKDPNMYLWVRRCELFTSPKALFAHLDRLSINIVNIEARHPLFPELTTITDSRGYKWYVCKAPIHGL